MAARRLIIVLLLLFGVSVIAAAIAPDRQGGGGLIGRSETTSTTTTTTEETTAVAEEEPEGGSGRSGESVTARIRVSHEDPETVRAFVGDQLQLYVSSTDVRVIEVPDFGATATAASNAPATFNLLLRDPGEFAIVDVDTGRVIGRLAVGRTPKHDNPPSG